MSNPYDEFNKEYQLEQNFLEWKKRQERLINEATNRGDDSKVAQHKRNLDKTNAAIGKSRGKQANLQKQLAASSSSGCLIGFMMLPLRLALTAFRR